MNKFFFIFNEFDPVSENLLNLVEHVAEEINVPNVLLMYDKQKSEVDVFTKDKKLLLINLAIENRHKCQFYIDGDSFINKKAFFVDKILGLKKKYPNSEIYWVMTNQQYKHYSQSNQFNILLTQVNMVYYQIDKEVEDLTEAALAREKVIYINRKEGIDTINETIHEVRPGSFAPIVLKYINSCTECAIKRIKKLEVKERFAHSLRVAGTIKKICEFTKVEDQNFFYKCYVAAIYHDCSKNMAIKKQIEIAKDHLGITTYKSPKVLHGPVGAWYMRNYFQYDDEEVLNAVVEHTEPSQNPTLLVKYLYLADKLELNKQENFTVEEYSNYWYLISQNKANHAFQLLMDKYKDRYEVDPNQQPVEEAKEKLVEKSSAQAA